MKKKIPKFDMKAWEEKQAKSAENYKQYESTPWLMPVVTKQKSYVKDLYPSQQQTIDDLVKKIEEDQKKLGQQRIIVSGSNSITLPPGIVASTPWTQYVPTSSTLGDPGDAYIFDGGEDGERDKQLPMGHSDDSWYSYDPAFEKKPVCCREEDKVNIGMLHDKWCCKVCGKDM